ncbi:Shikimate dehydrogenase (NADP(+)) [bioreactor metagenome]|uniref:Shikimate dehydrogenase (NADP(+)) n=1 Tax=bioreactor metagenome TaxID=1076179 RepID=A0A645GJV2_9ZZZZ
MVQYLKDNGINEIALVSRNKASAKCKFKDLDIYSYEEADLLRSHDMIINCTPCGMHPDIDVCPVPSDMIGKFSYAIDLIYNPVETLFLKYAREKGLTAANGLYMLAGQAVKSQELWNGIEIPISMVDEIYGQSVELRDQNSELRG